MEVRGRNLIEGIPKTLRLPTEEIREATDTIATIVNAVRIALERRHRNYPPILSNAGYLNRRRRCLKSR